MLCSPGKIQFDYIEPVRSRHALRRRPYLFCIERHE
jgi:hypothetical protein